MLAFATIASSTAWAFDADEAKLVDQGFKVFTKEKFKGNGRTCASCHIPEADYNIGPSDLPALKSRDLNLVLATKNPDLENPTLVNTLTLFNINGSELGTGDTPAGPLRASMAIGGLGFSTLNNFVNADPHADPPILPGVDDGTRAIGLGWAGDGAIDDPDRFPDIPASQDCRAAVNSFLANDSDLFQTLRSFSLAAVRQHFPKSLARVPGVDFRCPTPAELDAMAEFQMYLGRQFELALSADTQPVPPASVITFNDATAETGKAIFLNNNAGCNACHFNAGANDTIGAALFKPTTGAPPTAATIPVPGANKSSHSDAELLREDLASVTTPVIIPKDPGDEVPGGSTKAGGFNVQSLIEAARKHEFFHNGGFTTDVEDAASFYFSARFDKAQSSARIRNVLRGGKTGPNALAALATDFGPNPLDTMGFFLRALSTVYSVADCERLVQDSIDRIDAGLPVKVPVLNCTTNLSDVDRVIAGAKVTVPQNYYLLQVQVPDLKKDLKSAANSRSKKRLANLLSRLKNLRQSIATISPDLP